VNPALTATLSIVERAYLMIYRNETFVTESRFSRDDLMRLGADLRQAPLRPAPHLLQTPRTRPSSSSEAARSIAAHTISPRYPQAAVELLLPGLAHRAQREPRRLPLGVRHQPRGVTILRP